MMCTNWKELAFMNCFGGGWGEGLGGKIPPCTPPVDETLQAPAAKKLGKACNTGSGILLLAKQCLLLCFVVNFQLNNPMYKFQDFIGGGEGGGFQGKLPSPDGSTFPPNCPAL